MTPSLDQIRAGYARNAEQLERLALKAIDTGKLISGYTVEELRLSAADYGRIAAMDDVMLLRHLQASRDEARAQLHVLREQAAHRG